MTTQSGSVRAENVTEDLLRTHLLMHKVLVPNPIKAFFYKNKAISDY